MAFIEPMHRNKPNITYLLHFTKLGVYCQGELSTHTFTIKMMMGGITYL